MKSNANKRETIYIGRTFVHVHFQQHLYVIRKIAAMTLRNNRENRRLNYGKKGDLYGLQHTK